MQNLDFLLHSLEYGSTHMIPQEVLRGYSLDIDELWLCKCSKRKIYSIMYFKSFLKDGSRKWRPDFFFFLHVLAAFFFFFTVK